MRRIIPRNKAPAALWAAALVGLAALTPSATPPPLQGNLLLRPLAPSDVTISKLPTGTETASGMKTIGVGPAAYLEAQVNLAVPASDIQSVTWTLQSQPIGSTAVITNSPLGTNVPIYLPANQLVARVAGRALLRPDLRGQY